MSVKKIICTFISVMILVSAIPMYAADISECYEWGQAKIGGGGYVTGAVFHPQAEGLAYVRTDVGGMYRRNSIDEDWEQLFDFPGAQDNLYGVDGFAVDPNNADVVYAALGMYYWLDGGLYKSTDRGESWTKLMSARCNGNKLRRNCGECVAVDPANSNVIYFGTRKEGLYRSEDGGKTWETPADIEYKVDDETSYGIRNIVIDTSQGVTDDGVSKVIYLGSAGVGVYKSTDGGETFALLEGSPADPFRMSVSSTGELYVSDDNGLFKYDDGEWTDISPVSGAIYQALAVSPDDPNVVLACVNSGNIMLMPVYLSQDGGATWKNTFTGVEFTEQVGWLESDNFSSNTCSVAIDPFDPKHIMITDWFGVWETYDITAEPVVQWQQKVYGIEETCPYKAVSPPSGDVRLHLGVADNDGFSIKNLDEYPERKFTDRFKTHGGPRFQSTTDLAFCEEDPNIVVRAGIGFDYEAAAYSLDGGETWNEFETSPIEDYTDKGCFVTVGCKKNEDTGYPTIIFNQGGYAVKLSRDMGETWTSLPFENICTQKYDRSYNKLEADKVNPNKFYIYNNDNKLHISDDGGATWYEGAAIPETTQNLHIRTAPGIENEIWVGVGGEKLYRSSDGGKTLTAINGISNVQAFCFGMPMTGSQYPTAFVYATLYGREGIYRSTNMGRNWIRINPDDFVLKSVVYMEGDRQHEGVVYLAHEGTGVYYLEPKASETEIIPEGAKYTSDFADNADGWNFSGSMAKQTDSLGCGGWETGAAVLEDYTFTDSYEIYAKATCTGTASSNRIQIRFNYLDENNYLALEILGGNNSELSGGARLYKLLDGIPYVFSEGEWYENTDANAEKISNGLVHYETDYYTYTYRIVYDADGYITVYKYDDSLNEELIFDSCAEADLSYGKLGFYAKGTAGSLASISAKTNPVIVRKISADSEGTTVELLDNGFLKSFKVILSEKDKSGALQNCWVTSPDQGRLEVEFPAIGEGNSAEVFVFNDLDALLPAAGNASTIKK